MHTKYFYSFTISFIGGIALEEIVGFGLYFGIFCAVLAGLIFLIRCVISGSKRSFLVSLVLLGCAFGVFRVDVSQVKQNAHTLDSLVGKVASIKGIVIEEPDVRENYTNIVLETEGVSQGQARILIRVLEYPALRYGDEVELSGKVVLSKNFTSRNGVQSFDYKAYLAKDNIHYQMYFPKLIIVSHDKGNMVREKLFAFKEVLLKNIARVIPEPEASLAGGVLLGAKQSLGDDLLQKFRETGVAHIVVLSGYNIAVVAGVMSRIVMFLPFTLRLVASALGIILFAVMVGGGATVVRASVMALVVILARVLGRESDALRVLVLAGGMMVLVNPMILLHDVSFQLSFVATLAIVALVPVVEKYFLWVSSRILREIMVTTFATQFFVLPLILYHMGSVSLIGFIANIFVLPVVPIAMLAVALVAVFAGVPLVGSALSFVAYAILAYVVTAVEVFARVPFASLSEISFPLWMLVASYFLLGYFIIKNSTHTQREKKSNYEF